MTVPVRERILQSGDEQLVRILRILPEESFARLKGILQAELTHVFYDTEPNAKVGK